MSIVQLVTFVALMATTAGADCAEKKPEESCKCVLGCEVMGGDGGECSDDKKKNAELAAKKTPTDMSDKTKMCDVLKCGAYCANAVECNDDATKKNCEDTKKMVDGCDVDCNGVNPTSALGFATLLFALVVQSL